ncbi:MAG: hypothetical protein JST85_28600 [Acidobacteria bacterium]|nr:hypothetical protein [Acidobacteriota bacterium]
MHKSQETFSQTASHKLEAGVGGDKQGRGTHWLAPALLRWKCFLSFNLEPGMLFAEGTLELLWLRQVI